MYDFLQNLSEDGDKAPMAAKNAPFFLLNSVKKLRKLPKFKVFSFAKILFDGVF